MLRLQTQLAEMAIAKAGRRLKAAKKSNVKDCLWSSITRKTGRLCVGLTREDSELFIVEGIQQVEVLNKRVTRIFAIMPIRGKF